jgi:hypothetical protein
VQSMIQAFRRSTHEQMAQRTAPVYWMVAGIKPPNRLAFSLVGRTALVYGLLQGRLGQRDPLARVRKVGSASVGRMAAPPQVLAQAQSHLMQIPKQRLRRSEAYRRYVASLPCAHCGRPGPSQCAHSDQGKGMAMKAGDDTCFPLCADSPGFRGCHSSIGASAAYSRAARRELEVRYASEVRRIAKASNQWPKEWA